MTVSSKIRIYDLAKELKLDTKRLIEEVRREGVDVSVPSNSVSKELAEKIRNKYFPKKETAVKRGVRVVKRAEREIDERRRAVHRLQNALAAHPGLRVVETYDIKEDPVRCAEIIATGTNRYPDLSAWISVGGWPVFTRNALAAVDPAKTKVISFDTTPPAPEILKAGKAQVLLGQKYFGWGSESVRLLTGIIAGRPPQQPIIDSGVDVVTRENVDDYAARWKKMESGS